MGDEYMNTSDRWAKTYMELQIWKKAIEFVTKIYKISALFPKIETMGLSSQMRRASVSIPSNIAEGYGRKSKADFTRFCQRAMGFLFEVQTQLTISYNLGYVSETVFQSIFADSREIERMLSSFIDKLKS